MPNCGISRSSPRPRRRRGAPGSRRRTERSTPGRAATATRASSTTRSGRSPALEARRDVRAHHEGQLAPGMLIRKQLKRTVGVGRALAADLERRRRETPATPATAAAVISSRTLAARARARSACAAPRRSAPGSARRARAPRPPPGRAARCPRCGGLKAPPRTPTGGPAPATRRIWPCAVQDVLGRGQLAQADRAAGVQLLGRVADLGAHPELEPVGEAGRGVDVDAGRVDAAGERVGGRLVGAGDDRLRVTACRDG